MDPLEEDSPRTGHMPLSILKTLEGERKQSIAHTTSVSKRMLVGLLPRRVGRAGGT